MTTVTTEQLALPRPESWREEDAWRVAFVIVTDHQGNHTFSVDAGTNSSMVGTDLEQLDVSNPRAALWVEYKGKGYTFHWRYDYLGPEGNELRGTTSNERAQRRASSKVFDYAPPTHHDAIYLAVFQSLEKVLDNDGTKLFLDHEKQRARKKHLEYLDGRVAAAQEALADAKRERSVYILPAEDTAPKFVQQSLFPDLVPDKEL